MCFFIRHHPVRLHSRPSSLLSFRTKDSPLRTFSPLTMFRKPSTTKGVPSDMALAPSTRRPWCCGLSSPRSSVPTNRAALPSCVSWSCWSRWNAAPARRTRAPTVAPRKLPVAVLRRLALQVGHRLEEAVPSQWLWKNRHVFLVDGATVSLPDTPENQQAYPQPPTQKPGLGFPMIRMVVLLSLATAGLQSLAFGPSQGKETGEPALLRTLLEQIPPGSILLADRYYCSYFLIALLQAYGVAVVFRLHQSRPVDFRRGRRLGPDDHLVTWRKPPRPKWLDPEVYATLPATLTVREVRTRVCQRGYRVEELVVTTTLMNPDQYSKDELRGC